MKDDMRRRHSSSDSDQGIVTSVPTTTKQTERQTETNASVSDQRYMKIINKTDKPVTTQKTTISKQSHYCGLSTIYCWHCYCQFNFQRMRYERVKYVLIINYTLIECELQSPLFPIGNIQRRNTNFLRVVFLVVIALLSGLKEAQFTVHRFMTVQQALVFVLSVIARD